MNRVAMREPRHPGVTHYLIHSYDFPALAQLALQEFPWAKAHLHYARAIGAARSGDAVTARREIDELSKIKYALTEVQGDYDWAKQVDIMRQVGSAWRYPKSFPYRVIYEVLEQQKTVIVAAVLHAARHDRQWKQRV